MFDLAADPWMEAAEYAEAGLMDAIKILQSLMSDPDQASTTRSTAVKTYIDVAVKLREFKDAGDKVQQVLDQLMREVRDEIPALGDADEEDPD